MKYSRWNPDTCSNCMNGKHFPEECRDVPIHPPLRMQNQYAREYKNSKGKNVDANYQAYKMFEAHDKHYAQSPHAFEGFRA